MSLHGQNRRLTFVLCSRICSWDYNLLSQASPSLNNYLSKNKTSIVFFVKTNDEKAINKYYEIYSLETDTMRLINHRLRLATSDILSGK